MRRSQFLIAGLLLMIFAAWITGARAADWPAKVIFFVLASDATPENREALAKIISDNGSLETWQNESLMFNGPAKFSLNGQLPAQVFGFCIPVKPAMGDALKAFLQTLNVQTRWATVANTTLAQYEDNELINENFTTIQPAGQIVTWNGVLTVLFNELGLRYIPPAESGL